MNQFKAAILQHVQKHGPIRAVVRSEPNLSPFQIHADRYKRMFRNYPDPIAPILRRAGTVKSAHELAPYLLAIAQMRPDFKIPKAPMFVEAVKLLGYRYCHKSDAAAEAAISPGYDIVPASDAARKEQVKHNEKIGKTYQGNRTVITKNPNVAGRFGMALGYDL